MHFARISCALVALALMPACGPGENDPGPGGVTVDEAQALDEAAAMLEERKLPPEALETGPAAEQGEEGAAATPDKERNDPDGR